MLGWPELQYKNTFHCFIDVIKTHTERHEGEGDHEQSF